MRVGGCLALLIAAFACGGCSRGESIPVEPVGVNLDAIPDRRFTLLAPLNEDRSQHAAVQLEDGRAWIVGQDGLILACDSRRNWRREECPRPETLYDAVAGPDGRVWACGGGGSIVVREADGWRTEETGTDADLRSLWSDGAGIWAVGEGGTVLQRTGGSWRRIECPTASSLNGISGDGSVYWVCSYDSLLLRYEEGEWIDESDGPWETGYFTSIARPEGGPVVLANLGELYRRAEQGWRHVEREQADGGPVGRLHARGGELWYESSDHVGRIRLGANSWSAIRYEGGAGTYFPNLGLAAGRDLLVAYDGGQVEWIGEDGVVTPEMIGEPDRNALPFELADGTQGFFDSRGLFAWNGMRFDGLAWDFRAFEEIHFEAREVDGGSPSDLYVATLFGLYHVVDGVAVARLEVEDTPGRRMMRVDAAGDLYFSQDDGLYRVAAGTLTPVRVEEVGATRHWVERLRSDRIVAVDGWLLCHVLEDGDWTSRDMSVPPSYLWEMDDGAMAAFHFGYSWSDPTVLMFWRGDSAETKVPFRLVPGDETQVVESVRRGLHGVYACTREPSRIFRLDESDPLAARWDAVTGLYAGDATEFLPLDDGSLLVCDNRNDHILLYRDRFAD